MHCEADRRTEADFRGPIRLPHTLCPLSFVRVADDPPEDPKQAGQFPEPRDLNQAGTGTVLLRVYLKSSQQNRL